MVKGVRGLLALCVVMQSTGCLFDEIKQQQSVLSQDMQADMDSSDMPAGDMAGEDMVADMSVDMKATCPEGRQDNDGDGACSPACDVLTCGAPANTCDDSSGLIECICALGYMGPRCGTCAEGHHREAAVCVPDEMPACNLNCGEQECQIINGMPQCVGGQPMCSPACGPGQVCRFDANNMPQCMPDTCMPGTQDLNGDGECHPTCAVWEMGNSCGRGTCVIDMTEGQDSSGKPVCDCEEGWRGSSPTTCDVCADGYVMDNGECVVPQVCQNVSCDAPLTVCEENMQGAGECVCVSDSSPDGNGACVCNSGFVYDSQSESCVAGGVQTCGELKSRTNVTEDGYYTLHINGDLSQPWWVWCADMNTSTPLEYLPLAMTHDNHNVFERFGEPGGVTLTPEPYNRRLTRTRYEKVRFNPLTMKIDIMDTRFAQTEVEQDTTDSINVSINPVPFGVAQGCGEQLSDPNLREVARGRLDLRGTPFVPFSQWVPAGVCASGSSAAFSGASALEFVGNGGSQVYGGCGAIVPADIAGHFPSGCTTVMPPATPGSLGSSEEVITLQYFGQGVVSLNPKTCAEAKMLGTCTSDGACTLYVGRDGVKSWTAQCRDMSTAAPKTYVQLDPVGGEYWPSTQVDAGGMTTHDSRHQLVEIDGHSMRVNINDQTFASTPSTAMPQPFAVGYSCSQSVDAFMLIKLAAMQDITWKSEVLPFGECAQITTPVNMPGTQIQHRVHGGSHKIGATNYIDGCGGVAPAPYARQYGYLACDATAPVMSSFTARPSTQQDYLLEMQHINGNP